MQITFRKMSPSPAVRDRVRERVEKLSRIHERITGCRVVVEAPQRHHHKGGLFTVAVEVQLPGGAIASHRNPDQRHAHEDVYVAVRDAFDSLERQLRDFVQRKTA
jgi:ribosomal subunit interface protein